MKAYERNALATIMQSKGHSAFSVPLGDVDIIRDIVQWSYLHPCTERVANYVDSQDEEGIMPSAVIDGLLDEKRFEDLFLLLQSSVTHCDCVAFDFTYRITPTSQGNLASIACPCKRSYTSPLSAVGYDNNVFDCTLFRRWAAAGVFNEISLWQSVHQCSEQTNQLGQAPLDALFREGAHRYLAMRLGLPIRHSLDSFMPKRQHSVPPLHALTYHMSPTSIGVGLAVECHCGTMYTVERSLDMF
jgi:hypothetical protein